MSVLVERPGLLTTVQDLGRCGYRGLGVNPSGAMDRTAARIANILAGNHEGAALLECHFPAPTLLFESDAVIAIAGADLSGRIGARPLKNWSSSFVTAGERLTFGSKGPGTCGYIAVRGGILADRWLGSRSTNIAAGVGGMSGRALKAGDRLELDAGDVGGFRELEVSQRMLPRYSGFPTVRILAGAEFDDLPDQGRTDLLSADLSILPNSDRMGFRLDGPSIERKGNAELLSAAVTFGTIQLLPDGQLIVLMADHQTSGGYARVAHVIERDLPLLAQLGPGDKVAFHLIGLDEAESLNEDFERELNFFKVGCRLLTNL